MKNSISILIMCSLLTFSAKAQIKIISNGNVGIGKDLPAQKLDINGSIRGNQAAGSVNIQTDVGYLKIGPINTSFSHFYTSSSNFYFEKGIDIRTGKLTSYDNVDLMLCTGSQFYVKMTLNNSTGNVGIGRSPHATAKLDVAGDIAVNGTIKLTSDIRFKENIKPLEQSLNKVALLSPISFNFKKEIHEAPNANLNDTTKIDNGWQEVENAFTKQKRYGFSAQDVQKVYPDLVTKDANGYLSVDYLGLIPVLVEAIKEQQARISELEKKLNALSTNKSN